MKPIVVALALILTGCSIFPTDEEIRTADYGRVPGDYQAIVQKYMDGYLRDGESARFKFLNPPVKFASPGFEKKFGYMVCVDVNAKNSFGAYVGYHLSYFLINNDRVVEALHMDGSLSDGFLQNTCKRFL